MVIKAMNAGKKKEEPAPAATPEDITLLREIRDALKK
jgi:large conductance mechanosensitive channel